MPDKFSFVLCTLAKKAGMFTVQPQKIFPSCNWHWRMAKLQLPGKLIYMEWLQWSRVYGALGWNLKSVFLIWVVQDEECRRTQKLRPGSRLWVPSLQRKEQAVKPGARSWGYPSQPGRSLGIGLFRVKARQLEKGTVTAELWTRLQNPGGQSQGSALMQPSPQSWWLSSVSKFSSAALSEAQEMRKRRDFTCRLSCCYFQSSYTLKFSNFPVVLLPTKKW